MVTIMHEQNVICSKTHLDGFIDEQTMICKKLLAGPVVGFPPTKKMGKMQQMIS